MTNSDTFFRSQVSFKAFNRDDIWGVSSSFGYMLWLLTSLNAEYLVDVTQTLCAVGVYQLWSLNNRGLGIDYLETIADQKGNSVLLDVLGAL